MRRVCSAAAGRPVVADVDGDGLVEVLAAGLDGILRLISQGKIVGLTTPKEGNT